MILIPIGPSLCVVHIHVILTQIVIKLHAAIHHLVAPRNRACPTKFEGPVGIKVRIELSLGLGQDKDKDCDVCSGGYGYVTRVWSQYSGLGPG